MGSGEAERLAEVRAVHGRVWEMTTDLVWGAAAWRRHPVGADGLGRGLVNVVVASSVEELAVRLDRQAAVEHATCGV